MKVGDKVTFRRWTDSEETGFTFVGEKHIGKECTVLKVDGSDNTLLLMPNKANSFWIPNVAIQQIKHERIGCKPLDPLPKKDKIVKRVLKAFKQRSDIGIKKYNTTLERTDLSTLEWLTHLQEEMMDATLYIERLKQEYDATTN